MLGLTLVVYALELALFSIGYVLAPLAAVPDIDRRRQPADARGRGCANAIVCAREESGELSAEARQRLIGVGDVHAEITC